MADSSRIQWLHKKISEFSYPNASRVAEKFGISTRQAQRMIVYLREQLGAPVAYDSSKKGFYYDLPYELPSAWYSTSEKGYYDLFSESADDEERQILQMQIPFTAKVKIADKLTVVELQPFIKSKLESNLYACEFQAVEKFLSAIFLCDAGVEILEPLWLREKLVERAEHVLKNNLKAKTEKENGK